MANRPGTLDPEVFTIKDLKEAGSKKLPKSYREFFNEGAMDLITLRDNEAAFDRYRIRPRILVNVSNLDTSTTFLGTKISFPLGFSPAAFHQLAHPDGEVATSRGAAKNNIPMALSMYSTCSLEDVIAQGQGNPYMMQITLLNDKAITLQCLKRAEKAGYKAAFITVDGAVLGRRLNEVRNNFGPPPHLKFPNVGVENADYTGVGNSPTSYAADLDWSTIIPWLKSQTKMQIWVKGIHTADDVVLAIRWGCDGIVVSNTGGRQLDGAVATLDALRECAPAAAGKIPIAIDGGIRRGTDIFKALALGASCCFVGRVPIWGLAYKGEQGVDLAIKLLHDEFRICMGLAGCRSVNEITRGHLSLMNANGVMSRL